MVTENWKGINVLRYIHARISKAVMKKNAFSFGEDCKGRETLRIDLLRVRGHLLDNIGVNK